MESLDLPLSEPLPEADLEVRRFSSDCAVVVRGRTANVFIGATLIGVFDTDDDHRGPRNVLAVTLAKSDQFHLGRLAIAFGMTDEHLRRLRRREETAGLGAILGLRRGKTTRVASESHAPVEETELAGKLVHHTGKLKEIIDVIRIASANVESELATVVAPHMRRPREAKKLLANLFAAPGQVVVTEHTIIVRLAPAANRSELDAIQHLLDHLNQRRLVLPSDHKRLPLRFETNLR